LEELNARDFADFIQDYKAKSNLDGWKTTLQERLVDEFLTEDVSSSYTKLIKHLGEIILIEKGKH
jgi:hypothetical protein